jgi:hypothetical protein
MSQNTERHRDTNSRPLSIHAAWRTGPRSQAWDQLWARILDDLHSKSPKRTTAPLSEGELDA